MKTIWVKKLSDLQSQALSDSVESDKPDNSVVEMDIEEYVRGVVPREVYDTWPMAVLEAQAIAARTYALATTKHGNEAFDVCSTTCCQVYSDARSTRCTLAVERTKGVVGIHKVRKVLVPTFFSACCGGQTRNTWDPSYLRKTTCPCHQHTMNGHGQGMCQWGAYELAQQHRTNNWRAILDHYYDLKWVDNYGEGEIYIEHSTIGERLSRIENILNYIRRVIDEKCGET